MKKVRIIKRENLNKTIEYVIQEKHFLFRWWIDAWVNRSVNKDGCNSFETLELAKNNLCYFDGSKAKVTIMFEQR